MQKTAVLVSALVATSASAGFEGDSVDIAIENLTNGYLIENDPPLMITRTVDGGVELSRQFDTAQTIGNGNSGLTLTMNISDAEIEFQAFGSTLSNPGGWDITISGIDTPLADVVRRGTNSLFNQGGVSLAGFTSDSITFSFDTNGAFNSFGGFGQAFFDVSFIPAPSVVASLVLGGLALARRRR